MATKIRLQRGGRKGYAFYGIIIADARAPRDGKFIEKIGTYNPNTNPATVDLNFDRALYWVECGAQPTDTARNILKSEGVYLMKHLRGGVKKGAFDDAAAVQKFQAWKADKQKGTDAVRENEAKAKKDLAAKRLEAEKAINANIAKKVADKKAAEAVAKAEEEAAEAAEETVATAEEAVEAVEEKAVKTAEEVVEAAAEAPVADPTTEETTETPAETAEETPAEA
ncbi:ribosomal protein S16 [Hoylesella saccharolytica F0055]|uniref:Small ribosomal subunit protein bS16 n=1 Tax=Hoylesella saccharolytica F0055 TaxID=1127699 RepID=L1NHJ6_9BACT|nr:30S ribosomal protein S16 [Hoylesella saccharolytica]EKY02984.1 ribosomal protein S16 [Hoylesella saccharolytica F0055]